MLVVNDLKKYFKEQSLQGKKEEQLFYNYILGFCLPSQSVDSLLFQQFYRKALLFPYQHNKLHSLQAALKEAFKTVARVLGVTDNIQEKLITPDWQILKIQHPQDLKDMVTHFLQKELSSEDKLTVLPLDTHKVCAVLLKFDGRVKIRTFNSSALIHKGIVEPISPLSTLHYLPSLKLNPAYLQILELDTKESFMSFTMKNQQIHGQIINGNGLHSIEQFKINNIEEKESLFVALKKLENLFIQPESDPYYKKLVQSLHEQYRQILIQPKHQLLISAQKHTAVAKKALKNLYPNNQLLILLIANIDFHIQKHQSLKAPDLKML